MTVEFVCAIPLFLGALALAFEFGQAFLAHQSTVHNVRAATRFLSRVDPKTNLDAARNIVRTGRINDSDVAPAYLEAAVIDITDQGTVDGDVDIWRIQATVNYQTMLFGFLGLGDMKIPFVVREDFRIVGH